MSGNHHEGLPRLFTNPPWMRHAQCVGKTEQFFGQRGNSTWARRAKDICATCPHRVRCLEFAIDNQEDQGIWGGKTVRERDVIARNRRALGHDYVPAADHEAALARHLEREQWWRAQMGRMAEMVEATAGNRQGAA